MILAASIALNYLIVSLMAKLAGAARRLCLFLGLALNLGILFCFKYHDFFMSNVNAAFKTDYSFWGLALPLGISFYTFQQLSYVIDSYRGDCEKYSFLEYAAYVSFFPQLVAGPIVYHDELIPQLRDRKNHSVNYGNLSMGIYAFSLGLAKKVLVADSLSKVVTAGYADIGGLNCISTVFVMICYSMQIYFDFSGYCDMAYGIGFMFNVELPVNFNSPYKAASVREFWERWHMTLTRFFTKYVYIPLGGSRKGRFRTYLNIMIVFLVSGIWHGANWTFILWGVVNGLGSLFDRVLDKFLNKIPNVIRRTVTFVFCCIAWSMFRADSVEQGFRIIGRLKITDGFEINSALAEALKGIFEIELLGRIGLWSVMQAHTWLLPAALSLILMLVCRLMRNTQEKAKDNMYNFRRIAVTVGLLAWSVLSLSEVSEFLYFNF